MRYFLQIICFVIICPSCTPNNQSNETYKSNILKIERITHQVFQHTSYLETRSLGTVPCNGMVYINENEAIVC